MNLLDSFQKNVVVTSWYAAPEVANKHGATNIISLLSPNRAPPSFRNVHTRRHHEAFTFEDTGSTNVDTPGLPQAVERLVAIGKDWNQASDIPRTVVHCHWGVSRSTAAAYIMMNGAIPSVSPDDHFKVLLKMTRKPVPNFRMVKLAGAFLKAGDAMLTPLDNYLRKNPDLLDHHCRMQDAFRRGINMYHTNIHGDPLTMNARYRLSEQAHSGDFYINCQGQYVMPGLHDELETDREAIYTLVRNGDKILMVLLNADVGYADLPGGGIHKGESLIKARGREWFEETCIDFPFSPERQPDKTYTHIHNFFAENANVFLTGYRQTFHLFDITNLRADDMTVNEARAVGLLKAKNVWETIEGIAQWVPIARLNEIPINHLHMKAIKGLVPETRDMPMHPGSKAPRAYGAKYIL